MTGRFGGRRARGRGRGGGRTGPAASTAGAKKKKTVEDYYFYVGSNKQASDYQTTAEFVVNHIKKTFDRGNDVAESLRTLKPQDTTVWEPTLQISSANDETTKKTRN